MKKAIKKYLTQLHENEEKGFSLVELIIVMAIMAILVGVVASQVIPYMEKSRQAKDQQQLSSLATDVTAAIASSAITAADVSSDTALDDITDIVNGPSDDKTKFLNELLSLRNDADDMSAIKTDLSKKMKSKAAKGGKIVYQYDTSTSKLTLKMLDGSDSEIKKLTVESE